MKNYGVAGKYARIENERRFLLPESTEEIITLPKFVILDHYITDTHLRLRQIEKEGDLVYKLTKKSKLSPGSDEITTIYLSPEEYQTLSKLRAIVVSKIRYIATYNGISIGIDIYGTEMDELWLGEVEFETVEQMEDFKMPLLYQREVTGNDDFSGLALANRFGCENRRF
jgi:CYTH domain-containing protein